MLRYLNRSLSFCFYELTGSDVARGMLVFGRGRPLGEKGLEWLKIHLVNLHGSKKKVSMKERAEYADEMMDEIMDSADYPMEVRR